MRELIATWNHKKEITNTQTSGKNQNIINKNVHNQPWSSSRPKKQKKAKGPWDIRP